MARSIRVFDVLVASPQDVAEERERLETVINELNGAWQDNLEVRLNLIRWETHTYPGFGVDAQDVINKELPDTNDVFIGILWSRVGTPTGRAESGTLEEFERAYAQWKGDPNSIKLLIYFKKANIKFDDIDPEQFSRVRDFKNSLPEKGGFYWEFDTSDAFEKNLRKHLTRLVQDLSKSPEDGNRQAIVVAPTTTPAEYEEEEGLFDLVDQWSNGMDVITGIIETFTSSMIELGEAVGANSTKINDLDIPNNPSRKAEAKRLINSMANQLDLFANILLPDTPVLDEAFGEATRALDKAIELAPDFGQDGIENICSARTNLVAFDESIRGSMEAIKQMKEIIQGLPRVTTHFNRAKRKSADAIASLYQCLSEARTQMESTRSLIEKLCEGT